MIEIGQPNGGYVLTHGKHRIPFHVEFGDRKQLTIHVHPELRLEVLAPQSREIDRVLERVNARSGWIVKQWRYFQQYHPESPARQYISGETYRYLGRQYRLKVRKSKESSVKLKGRFLNVEHPDKSDKATIKLMVEAWYRSHAVSFFKSRLEQCLANCRSLELRSTPRVTVRTMRRRWGSCTKAGNISLNVELVMAPIHCIDYVIVHELCHLKIHNHGRAFYRLLSQCMSDWESRKKRLDSFCVN